jgi:hypothetical protein
LTGRATGSLSSGAPSGIWASVLPPKVTGIGVVRILPSGPARATVIAPTFQGPVAQLIGQAQAHRLAAQIEPHHLPGRHVAEAAHLVGTRATATAASGAAPQAADQLD